MARMSRQSCSRPSKVVGGVRSLLGEERLVVVEILGDGVGRDAVVPAFVHEGRLPAVAEAVPEAALGVAEVGDVERQPLAHQPRGILAGPVEEDVRRLGAGERDLDLRLVGLVGEVLVDDVHVRVGLLVLLGRIGDELRVPLGHQGPHLDVHRRRGAAQRQRRPAPSRLRPHCASRSSPVICHPPLRPVGAPPGRSLHSRSSLTGSISLGPSGSRSRTAGKDGTDRLQSGGSISASERHGGRYAAAPAFPKSGLGRVPAAGDVRQEAAWAGTCGKPPRCMHARAARRAPASVASTTLAPVRRAIRNPAM